MPNTLTNIQDIRIADKFLETFVAALTPLRAFSTDFSSEFLEKGKTVNVPVIGASGASQNFAGSYKANAGSTVEGLPVVLEHHKFQNIIITDKEASESSFLTLERLAISKARRLAQDVLTHLWSLVTAANYGAESITPLDATAFDAAKVLALRGVCAAANMPLSERALILSDSYYTNLLGDPKVSQSYLMQMSQPALIEAKIPRISGFDVYESVIIPDNGERLVGFAAHPRGMAVAMRYLEPLHSESYIAAAPVTDPETGITLGYRRYYDTDSGAEIAAFECLYGFRKALGDGIKRITAPAPTP